MTDAPKRTRAPKPKPVPHLIVCFKEGIAGPIHIVAGDTITVDLTLIVQNLDPPILVRELTGRKVDLHLRDDGVLEFSQYGDTVAHGPAIVCRQGVVDRIRKLFGR